MFDANKAVDYIVKWIQDWFEQNGKGCNAVIGISGGKDSTITAALLIKALGKERVFGVLMPHKVIDSSFNDGIAVVRYLGIKSVSYPISDDYDRILWTLSRRFGTPLYGSISDQTRINLPARMRMVILYAISQSVNGRVANTCNLSEDWVGYSTRYGDSVGDFSPLSNYTVTEVRQIGMALGLPVEFVYKIPSDGLCGKTDEDNLGFTYDILDRYIRTGECEDKEIKARIDELHEKNKFKLELMQSCPYCD